MATNYTNNFEVPDYEYELEGDEENKQNVDKNR